MFDGRQVAGDLESSKQRSETHLIKQFITNASEGYYEYFILSISSRCGFLCSLSVSFLIPNTKIIPQHCNIMHLSNSLNGYQCRLPCSSCERNMRPEPPSEWRGAEGRVGHVWENLQWNICQETVTKRGGRVGRQSSTLFRDNL